MIKDLGLLILRLTVGGLLGGHGSQKLFGWFGGYGIQGTAGFLESMNFKPGHYWAAAAGTSEFGGGALTALGFLHPLGPIGTLASMIMATATAHRGKPIWSAEGGAELPVTNIAAALALALTGPGRFSLDSLFGIRLPRWLVVTVILVEAALIGIGLYNPSVLAPTAATQEQPAAKVEGGQGANSL
jgi:putative oxidoreductase